MRGEGAPGAGVVRRKKFFELLAEDANFGIESRASLVAARCVERQVAAASGGEKSLAVLQKLC